MNGQDIINRRLISQHIAGGEFTEPAGLIQWMGCMRADDFAAGKWAIGNRVAGSTDKTVEHAFNKGDILWTYVLRPERHFISAADIRWMLALTSPKIKAFNKEIYRALGIDGNLLRKSKRIITMALEKGQLTRGQLWGILADAHIRVDELRLGWMLMDAELDGLICSGGVVGHQVSYALLDHRAPPMAPRKKEELVAELTRRYFRSRGPATIQDFAGWSGLRIRDIHNGVEWNRQWLANEVVNGQVYWFDPSAGAGGDPSSLFLLPALDEWVMAYSGTSFYRPMLVIAGHIAGTWTSVLGKDTVGIKIATPGKLDGASQEAVRREAARYGGFLGKELC